MNSADLVAQLRKAADEMRAEDQNGWPVTCDEAADRIEALEAWKAEATEVLRPFADMSLDMDTTPDGYPWRDGQHIVRGISAGNLRAARRLVEKEDGRHG